MKFILNTAVDPHFCVLFDEDSNLIERKEWTDRRRDGIELFEFLKKYDLHNLDITFCGGVSGPGGFSSLRAGGGVLNAISFAKGIPVHQVRADKWIEQFICSKVSNISSEFAKSELKKPIFLLNSFSNGVFYREYGEDGDHRLQEEKNDKASSSALAEYPNSRLQIISVDEAAEKFKNTEIFVELLPSEKQEKFKKLEMSFENSEKVLLQILEKTKPQENFNPDYEFPPV